MAEIFRRMNGKGTAVDKAIAKSVVVQQRLDVGAFEIGVRAEDLLLEHQQEGHARIQIASGDVDRYVILDDDAGDEAALSIEFGRAGYIDPETGETYGAMDGLYILTQAAGLKKDRSKRLPKERKRQRKSKGGKA
jgi:hypothetical protein